MPKPKMSVKLRGRTLTTEPFCAPCEAEKIQAASAAIRRREERRIPEVAKPMAVIEVPLSPTAEVDADPVPREVEDGTLARWSGIIAVEGQLTGDGRYIEHGALHWPELPIPMRWDIEDDGEHKGAVVVGLVEVIERQEDGKIWGAGFVDLVGTNGREAARLMNRKMLRGVSIDPDDVDFEIRIAADVWAEITGEVMPGELELPDPNAPVEVVEVYDIEPETNGVDSEGRITVAKVRADAEVMAMTEARIRAVTLVDTPAFPNAQVQLDKPLLVEQPVYESVVSTNENSEDAVGNPLLATGGSDRSAGLLAVDGGADERCAWSAVRPGLRGRWKSGAETREGASRRLGVFAGTDPRGPDRGPSVQGLPVLQSRAHGTGDGRGEHQTRECGESYEAAGNLWVWAPVLGGEHVDGVAVAEGWFAVPSTNVSDLSEPGVQESERSSKAVSKESRLMDLVASAAPVRPPAGWFADPKLASPTPFTVTGDGRVFGHIATWGTCHTGFAKTCVQPPTSSSGYAWFRTGVLIADDDSEVAVGRVTVDTGHAGMKLSAHAAVAHYDDTGMAVADVVAGEDVHGIWVAGALRPNVTDEQLRVLRSSPPSGDWRRVGSGMELMAVLGVNMPGFPVPRALVASGRTQSLVLPATTGVAAPEATLTMNVAVGSLTEVELVELRALAAEQRAARRDEAAEMASRMVQHEARALAFSMVGRG